MTRNKRNFIFSGCLLLLAAMFTISVKLVDAQPVGVNCTSIGFATLNMFIFDLTGTHMIWYHITDWLGLVPIFMAFAYAFVGLCQLIKRKSLFKVSYEILVLGLFYIVLIALYLFFENTVINYRPILIDGFLEASYPSSHTLMAICLCGSSIIVNKKLFDNKFTRLVNLISIAIIVITVMGRLISGVHWFTDILGGVIISFALLMTFYSIVFISKGNKRGQTD